MVVYELLVRDFVQNRTYQTVTDSLAYLKRLGINTIELMPVTEFSGNDSWGYNPIYYFAPDKAYGPKDALKRFIDAAHKQGIAVVLDMVLNQADYEFPYVKMYWAGDRPSADSPYFNQQATHPFSVFFDFNHESRDTKTFVDRVCAYWLQEYKVDGFRFDLSKGFTQKNTGNDVGAWGAYDASRIAIWKRIYNQIRTVDPTAYVILEHFADNQEETELANYGMLLWGNHNGDFRGATRSAQGDFSGLSYQKRNFQQPNLIGYAESHDEERLVYDMRQNGLTSGNLQRQILTYRPGPGQTGRCVPAGHSGPENDLAVWRTGLRPVYQHLLRRYNCKRWMPHRCQTRSLGLLPGYRPAETVQSVQCAGKAKNYRSRLCHHRFHPDFSGVVKRLTLRSASGTVFLIGNFDIKAQTVNPGLSSHGQVVSLLFGAGGSGR